MKNKEHVLNFISDIAFTPSVKALQQQYGSRRSYEKMENGRGWLDALTPPLIDFISHRDSFYMATSTKEGQPYIQHRGGAPGFLKVLDTKTLAFADFSGNQQYISAGNLAENPKAFLFLMDYPSKTRVKIWGEATVEYDDTELMNSLAVSGYTAKVERAFIFTIHAIDVNCPQHIVERYTLDEIEQMMVPLKERIIELENEINTLK